MSNVWGNENIEFLSNKFKINVTGLHLVGHQLSQAIATQG